MTRGTELDLRQPSTVRYYLSGRQGDELNNGAMAQLVARFHGMEEVGGSNPPSSTENSDTQLVGVGFLLFLDGLSPCLRTSGEGYRRKRGALDGVSWV